MKYLTIYSAVSLASYAWSLPIEPNTDLPQFKQYYGLTDNDYYLDFVTRGEVHIAYSFD